MTAPAPTRDERPAVSVPWGPGIVVILAGPAMNVLIASRPFRYRPGSIMLPSSMNTSLKALASCAAQACRTRSRKE